MDNPGDMEQLKSQLGNVIVHLFRDKLSSRKGIRVQGLVGLTVDSAEIALIQIDEYVAFDGSESTDPSVTFLHMETSLPAQTSPSPVSLANSLQSSGSSAFQISNVIGHVKLGQANVGESDGVDDDRQHETLCMELRNNYFHISESPYEDLDVIVKVEQPWCHESVQLSDVAQQSFEYVNDNQCAQATDGSCVDQPNKKEGENGLLNNTNSAANGLQDNVCNSKQRDRSCRTRSRVSKQSILPGAYPSYDKKICSILTTSANQTCKRKRGRPKQFKCVTCGLSYKTQTLLVEHNCTSKLPVNVNIARKRGRPPKIQLFLLGSGSRTYGSTPKYVEERKRGRPKLKIDAIL